MKNMKKNLIYMAAALLLAGCSKDAATESLQPTGGEPIRFEATAPVGRTVVSTTAEGLLDIQWAAEDQVGIYALSGDSQTGRNISYTATPNEDNAAACVFTATKPEEVLYWYGTKAQTFAAYYPYTPIENAMPNMMAHPVSLPAKQVQAAANKVDHLATYGVMTAEPMTFEANAQLESAVCFNFSNRFSIVEFRLKSDANCALANLPIKALKLTSKSGMLAAPDATLDLTQSPAAISVEEGAEEVELALAATANLKRDAYTSFYMVVLPGTHAAASLQLDVTAIDNSVHAVPIAEGVTFEPNKHYVREYELTLDGFVAADPFEVELPNLTTKVGEPLTINFSGKANSIDFWSGEYGHDYAYATKDRMGEATTKMHIKTLYCAGNQIHPAKIKYSRDFNGTMTEEAIKAATWTDVSDQFTWPDLIYDSDIFLDENGKKYPTINADHVPVDGGEVICDDWFATPESSIYIAFFYHVTAPGNRTFFYLYDSWVKSFYHEGLVVEQYIQKFTTENNNKLGVKIVNAAGTNNPIPTIVLGSTYDSKDNNTLSWSPLSSDPVDYPNYLRIGAKYNGLTADHDAYLVLPKITYPEPQNLGKDKPFAAQTVGAETPASWSYTFTEAGTYKVCVVGTITTLAGEKSVVTEATITVTE